MHYGDNGPLHLHHAGVDGGVVRAKFTNFCVAPLGLPLGRTLTLKTDAPLGLPLRCTLTDPGLREYAHPGLKNDAPLGLPLRCTLTDPELRGYAHPGLKNDAPLGLPHRCTLTDAPLGPDKSASE